MNKRRTALISVYDKSGIGAFGSFLQEQGYRIVSTGGTAEQLRNQDIEVIDIEEWTGTPELISGRVKTLQPEIHAGILARRDEPSDMEELEKKNIKPIDMVVVNLYDLSDADSENRKLEDQIDIGGPTLLRAAAKNYDSVTVVPDPSCYDDVRSEMRKNEGTGSMDFRKELSGRVFDITSRYDRAIERELKGKEDRQQNPFQSYDRESLRYGSNPHQSGYILRSNREEKGVPGNAEKLHGKELSYNNYLDLDAGFRVAADLEEAGCTVIKHTVPCGAGIGEDGLEAFQKAHRGDPVSAYGSVLGLNCGVTTELAEHLVGGDYFIEGVIAPSYEKGVLKIFQDHDGWGERVRLLEGTGFDGETEGGLQYRSLSGGILAEQENNIIWNESELNVVVGEINDQLLEELRFAWTVCKHTPSNAITIGNDREVAGNGAGQPSRLDAARIAVQKAGDRAEGGVVASDAFFPFPDALEVAVEGGVRAAVQPGGSIRDEQVIEAAEEWGIAMIFTGIRHFKH